MDFYVLSTDLTKVALDVKNKSRVLFNRVGKLIICCREKSFVIDRKSL